jgi:hypothetical protein
MWARTRRASRDVLQHGSKRLVHTNRTSEVPDPFPLNDPPGMDFELGELSRASERSSCDLHREVDEQRFAVGAP